MKKHIGQSYVRDESNIKFIPTLCIPLLVLSILASLLLFILLVISCIQQNWTHAGCEAAGIALLLIFGIYCDHLDWHRNAQFVVDGNRLTYYYDLDGKVLPTSNVEVCVKFRKVTRVDELKNGSIKVYGDIEKKAPMGKPKLSHKFILKNFGEHHDAIVAALKTKIKD